MRDAACRKKALEGMADLVERWLEKSLVKYTYRSSLNSHALSRGNLCWNKKACIIVLKSQFGLDELEGENQGRRRRERLVR